MVRGDKQKKESSGETWSPIASMMNLKYLFLDVNKHKTRLHQLDFIELFLQAKVKNILLVKLDSRYADYFLEYLNHFGRALRLLKSM